MAYEKITVSGEKFINTLREVAAERPDYVYEAPDSLRTPGYEEACFYVHPSPDGPVAGCIIGATLERLGVPLDVLKYFEHDSAGRVMDVLLNITGPMAGAARDIAVAAQDAQDGSLNGGKLNWSDAVAHGEGRARGCGWSV